MSVFLKDAERAALSAPLRDLLLRTPSIGMSCWSRRWHHMVPVLGHHIISAGLRFDLPPGVYQRLESALKWNRWQIEVFRREMVRVAQGLAGRGIHFVVTKGMTFESTL
jgi:hypothetical protein